MKKFQEVEWSIILFEDTDVITGSTGDSWGTSGGDFETDEGEKP